MCTSASKCTCTEHRHRPSESRCRSPRPLSRPTSPPSPLSHQLPPLVCLLACSARVHTDPATVSPAALSPLRRNPLLAGSPHRSTSSDVGDEPMATLATADPLDTRTSPPQARRAAPGPGPLSSAFHDSAASASRPAAAPPPPPPPHTAYVLSWTPDSPWRKIPLPPASAFFGASPLLASGAVPHREPDADPLPPWTGSCAAGALAGAASRTVVSPLERLKIILQGASPSPLPATLAPVDSRG